MEGSSRKYTVSELANILGVPRTTINDWLTRYSQYIDFKLQGKRKIYLQSTLEVLREIAQLRESEISSFDIEEELAKKHPVHGEITSSEKEDVIASEAPGTPSESNETGVAGQPHLPELHQQEFALITRKQTDEIATLITEHLQHMADRIEEIEESNRVNSKKTAWWYVFSMALVILLLVLTFFGLKKFESLMVQNRNLIISNQDFSGRLDRTNEELSTSLKQNDFLKTKSTDLDLQLASLKTNLKKQEEEFRQMLEKERSNLKKQKEGEILKLKDEFAKTRLEFLKRIEQTAQGDREKDKLIGKLQQQAHEQTIAISNLSKKPIIIEREVRDPGPAKRTGDQPDKGEGEITDQSELAPIQEEIRNEETGRKLVEKKPLLPDEAEMPEVGP